MALPRWLPDPPELRAPILAVTPPPKLRILWEAFEEEGKKGRGERGEGKTWKTGDKGEGGWGEGE